MNETDLRKKVQLLVRKTLEGSLENGSEPAPVASSPARALIHDLIHNVAPIDKNQNSYVTRDESEKSIITETDLLGLGSGEMLLISENARLTPLAEDIIRQRSIKITRRQLRLSHSSSKASATRSKLIAVGADHGGYKMKQELISFLAQLGHRIRDCGTDSEKPVDYPDIAHAVAKLVSEASVDLGIIIDGAGVGSAMAANKVPGVRAAACYSVEVAKNSREHNDSNVLTLGSKTISVDQMREVVGAWISSEITEERHKHRVAKIIALERHYGRLHQ